MGCGMGNVVRYSTSVEHDKHCTLLVASSSDGGGAAGLEPPNSLFMSEVIYVLQVVSVLVSLSQHFSFEFIWRYREYFYKNIEKIHQVFQISVTLFS
jgi:hypothetical protein